MKSIIAICIHALVLIAVSACTGVTGQETAAVESGVTGQETATVADEIPPQERAEYESESKHD